MYPKKRRDGRFAETIYKTNYRVKAKKSQVLRGSVSAQKRGGILEKPKKCRQTRWLSGDFDNTARHTVPPHFRKHLLYRK